ncbi:MAG TPA: type II toxin-antitoxin system VapC family toxin [Cyclobacteriaceae bacterium]|nr:type II toxin-antitoxin system VapC family toxin [Cyclobacteriaceae bacterium]
MIVVDTSIIAALYFPSPDNQIVENLRRFDDFWVAPHLWKSEFRNVAGLYHRKGFISFEEAAEAVEIAEDDMEGYGQSVDSHEVLNAIRESSCSSYHCEFIALARTMFTFLVTFDKKILREFPGIATTPEDYIKINQIKE